MTDEHDEHSAAYQRGMTELRKQLGPMAGAYIQRLKAVAPKFAWVNVTFPFGEFYPHDVVDLKTRELCTVAALTVQGFALPQLKLHVDAASHVVEGAALPDHTIVAGELHALVKGRRARVGDLAAAMAGGKKAKTKEICFSAFDLVQDDEAAVSTPYDARHSRMTELIKYSSNLNVIPVEDINTAAQIKTRFEETVTTGEAEGLVIRLDSGLIYKLKPSVSIDAAIIGYTVKSDQPDSARSILLGLMHEDGRMQILGGCGNLGSDEDRKVLLPKLEKLKVESSVRYASDSGSL